MTAADLPALVRTSGAAAAGCQRWFFFWIRVQLGLIAATGLLSAWAPVDPDTDHYVSGLVALLMFLAFLVGLVLRLGRIDDDWFRARALAENGKSAAWRFMMRPRPPVLVDAEAEETVFLDELEQIRDRFPQIERHLSKYDGGGGEITEKMRQVKGLDCAERLAFYKQFRLQDQIGWYRTKAKINADAESNWSFALLAFEALAVVLAVVRILSIHEYNPTGAIAAIAACVLAWSQTKRFSDLANTYGVACRDLNGLLTRSDHVHDEQRLQALVAEVETAVSREHRLWVERRSAVA